MLVKKMCFEDAGKVPNLVQAVKLELLVAIKGGGRVTAFCSFTTCSKAPFGFNIRYCNELRRVGKNNQMLVE